MNITPEEASLQRIPTTFKSLNELDPEVLTQVEKLIDLLEDDEDVVQVYHNLEDDSEN
jgi:transcriptional/translational regulatory protein YebC/TACO1